MLTDQSEDDMCGRGHLLDEKSIKYRSVHVETFSEQLFSITYLTNWYLLIDNYVKVQSKAIICDKIMVCEPVNDFWAIVQHFGLNRVSIVYGMKKKWPPSTEIFATKLLLLYRNVVSLEALTAGHDYIRFLLFFIRKISTSFQTCWRQNVT